MNESANKKHNFTPKLTEIWEACRVMETQFMSPAELEELAQDDALYFRNHKSERDEDECDAYESVRQAHILANYVLKMSAKGTDEARAVTGTIYRHDAYIDQGSVTIAANLELKDNYTGIQIDTMLIPGKFGTLERLGFDHKKPKINVVVTHRDGQEIKTSKRYKRFKKFPATKLYEK